MKRRTASRNASRPMRRLVIAAAVSAAACFSDRPSGPIEPDGGEAVVVEMNEQLAFAPSDLSIRSGRDVVFRNTSRFVHTATGDPAQARDPSRVSLPPDATPWDSGVVPAGGEYRKTFDIPGEYRYVCLPHEAQGMLGRIVVSD